VGGATQKDWQRKIGPPREKPDSYKAIWSEKLKGLAWAAGKKEKGHKPEKPWANGTFQAKRKKGGRTTYGTYCQYKN